MDRKVTLFTERQSEIIQLHPDSGAPNSAKFRGVAEGQPRFDKGGVAIIFDFLRVKNITF